MSVVEARKLPDGWRWAKFGECAELINGRAYSQHELLDSGTPVIRIQNLNGGKRWYYSDLALPDEKYCQNDDLLFAWSATFGPYLWKGSEAIFHYHIWKIETYECLDKEFAHFLLQEITQEIREASHGMAMLHMTKSGMENWKVPLPPLPEQKRIAAILTEKLAAIEKARIAAESRLQATDELPAAYLRDVFGTEKSQKWPRRPLGEVCDITARMVDPKKEGFSCLPHVFGNNIESGMCRLTYLNSAEEDGMTSGKYLFKSGDVLYSKLRPYLRKVLVAEFEGLCSADMYPIEVDPDFLEPHFTAWMLLSDEFTKYAEEQSHRARMPKLNRDQLFAWEAPIPPLDVQRQLIQRHRQKISQVEMLRGLVHNEVEKINLMPPALLRQAFAGEL